jgi:hypothetical protein
VTDETNEAGLEPHPVRMWTSWLVANAFAGGIAGACMAVIGIPGIALFGVLGGVAQWRTLQQCTRVTPLWIGVTGLAGLAAWVAVGLYSGFAQLMFFIVGYFLSMPVLLLAPFARLLGIDISTAAAPVLLFVTFPILAGIGGAIAGAIVGFAQRLLLQRHTGAAARWLTASTIGGALAGAVVGDNLFWQAAGRTLDLHALRYSPDLTTAIVGLTLSGVVFGALYGLVTGAELAHLVTRTTPQA